MAGGCTGRRLSLTGSSENSPEHGSSATGTDPPTAAPVPTGVGPATSAADAEPGAWIEGVADLRNQHDLAVGPSSRELDERLPDLRERVGPRDRDLELAGVDHPEQLLQ